MDVVVLAQCRKEIDNFPLQVKEELLDAINDLQSGLSLKMPLSRKMEGLGQGVYELRFKERSGIYRVIYLMKKNDAIYLIHAFKKKSSKTSSKDLEVAKIRLRKLR